MNNEDSPLPDPASHWINRLIQADNLEALQIFLKEPWQARIHKLGGLKLIYIDPPFNTQNSFNLLDNINSFAFKDAWGGLESFLNMLKKRLIYMRELLAPDGCIYIHCDWRTNAHIRLLLDEIFGNFVNEIIWHYTGGGRSKSRFSRKHDTIFIYSKSGNFIFNSDSIRIPYKSGSAYAKTGIRAKSGKQYLPDPAGTIPDDVWDIPIVNPLANERTGYPTQKPEALLERIIKASSSKGELVADFFCGSGTLPAVATRLERRWLAVDCGEEAIRISKDRLHKLCDRLKKGGQEYAAFKVERIQEGFS